MQALCVGRATQRPPRAVAAAPPSFMARLSPMLRNILNAIKTSQLPSQPGALASGREPFSPLSQAPNRGTPGLETLQNGRRKDCKARCWGEDASRPLAGQRRAIAHCVSCRCPLLCALRLTRAVQSPLLCTASGGPGALPHRLHRCAAAAADTRQRRRAATSSERRCRRQERRQRGSRQGQKQRRQGGSGRNKGPARRRRGRQEGGVCCQRQGKAWHRQRPKGVQHLTSPAAAQAPIMHALVARGGSGHGVHHMHHVHQPR